jgi:hypothetical protein
MARQSEKAVAVSLIVRQSPLLFAQPAIQSAILREMAFQPMPLSREHCPSIEWRVAVAKETQYLDLTGHRGKTVPGLS